MVTRVVSLMIAEVICSDEDFAAAWIAVSREADERD